MRSDDVEEKNGTFKSKDDMIDMECLNEAELLYNLAVRLRNSLMYTYVGTTIIAVNPFCTIPDLYGPASL
jgi:myosin heavy subunit